MKIVRRLELAHNFYTVQYNNMIEDKVPVNYMVFRVLIVMNLM